MSASRRCKSHSTLTNGQRRVHSEEALQEPAELANEDSAEICASEEVEVTEPEEIDLSQAGSFVFALALAKAVKRLESTWSSVS